MHGFWVQKIQVLLREGCNPGREVGEDGVMGSDLEKRWEILKRCCFFDLVFEKKRVEGFNG